MTNAPLEIDQHTPSASETDEIARCHKRMLKVYSTFDDWARYFCDKPQYAVALSLIVAELKHEAFTPRSGANPTAWLAAWPGTTADALEYLQAQEGRARVAAWQAATDGEWCIFFDSIALTLKWPKDDPLT